MCGTISERMSSVHGMWAPNPGLQLCTGRQAEATSHRQHRVSINSADQATCVGGLSLCQCYSVTVSHCHMWSEHLHWCHVRSNVIAGDVGLQLRMVRAVGGQAVPPSVTSCLTYIAGIAQYLQLWPRHDQPQPRTSHLTPPARASQHPPLRQCK